MSITLRILGWALMILAGLLELANLILLLSSPNWGFVAFGINTAVWAVPFIGGYYLNRAGQRKATRSPDQASP